jgi:hypothetical protein
VQNRILSSWQRTHHHSEPWICGLASWHLPGGMGRSGQLIHCPAHAPTSAPKRASRRVGGAARSVTSRRSKH